MVDKADDAIAMWQQMFGEMQKGFRAFGNQLPTSAPGDSANPAGASSAQTQLANLMESYFAGMNLPSRAQLNALSDRLQAIEGELADIKALLHETLMKPRPVQAAPTPPAKTQKPPSSSKSRRQPPGPGKATLAPDGSK